ncbi:pyridoxal-phosphate dependent enzyme, partial [bacterium]|nr:pyridoxal-phosphate dependent enzyme [bacterium]
SWAAYRWLVKRLGTEPAWESVDDLRRLVEPLKPLRFVTATDGNHGRGVAWTARRLGVDAEVFMPRGTVSARIEAIRSEGATVTVVDGSYDETVRVAAESLDDRAVLIQDTGRPGYEEIPRWIVEGYATLHHEIERDQVLQHRRPDIVIVPVGVGSLAEAAVRHWRSSASEDRPLLVSVEPLSSNCLMESLRLDERISLPEGDGTIMAGLNCGTVSFTSWPILRRGLNLALALDDTWAADAVRWGKRQGLISGESGASGIAALLALVKDPVLREAGDALGVGLDSTVLLYNTEGITDPEGYGRLVDR